MIDEKSIVLTVDGSTIRYKSSLCRPVCAAICWAQDPPS